MNDPTPRDRSTDDPDEVFDLVDRDDRVIGRVRRGEAHSNPKLVHRSVQVLLFDGAGRVLLQHRSRTKDLYPGVSCASASGHVHSGDDYATTAARELREELGVSVSLRFIERRLIASPFETEMTALYVGRCDGPFAFHPGETDGGRFFTRAEIAFLRARGELPLTPRSRRRWQPSSASPRRARWPRCFVTSHDRDRADRAPNPRWRALLPTARRCGFIRPSAARCCTPLLANL